MKLKTVFAASLLVGGVAFAEDITTTYTVGVMPLRLTSQETAICVPWIESGQTNDVVAVTNFIKTAGLSANTELYWYNTNGETPSFYAWKIETNNGPWTSLSGSAGSAPAPSETSLKRGDAVVLKLPSAGSYNQVVYVIGQYTGTAASTTIAGGTSASPTFTLLANPDPSNNLTVHEKFTSALGSAEGDAITYADGATVRTVVAYMVSATLKWGYFTYKGGVASFNEQLVTIPAGQGFWYRRCSSEDITVSW